MKDYNNTMPVTYESIHIEEAQEYFLVPIKDQDSLFYLGNKNKLNALKIAMDASKVIATSGVASVNEDESGTRCYILLDTDKTGCEEIMNEVDQVLVGNLGIKNDKNDIKNP